MNKINQLTILSLIWLMVPVSVFAADSLAVQVFQPKSPTNVDNFKLNFVALDSNNNPITVKCFKQSPGESSFSQFDGDKAIKAGGNSGYCSVTGSILSTQGTYKFFVTANGVSSETVTVDYNTSTPGTPNSYSKNKINACDYTIKVKTDNDGGKTTKIVLYRSDSLSFSADSGTQVDSRNVGSDTWVEMTNSAPDCNKTYYYAVRAYNSAGNGSGIIGDEKITVVSGTTTTTSATSNSDNTPATNRASLSEAIPVEESSVTAPEEENKTTSPEIIEEGVTSEVLGTKTNEPFWKSKNARMALLAALIALILYFQLKSKKK